MTEREYQRRVREHTRKQGVAWTAGERVKALALKYGEAMNSSDWQRRAVANLGVRVLNAARRYARAAKHIGEVPTR